jgi:hypothetical protein
VTSTHSEGDDSASSTVTEGSRLVAAARAIGDWTRQSFLYRWLTKEPDPEVIVIDLRETYTVGPIITLLDRLGARLAPWWRASGCRRLCVWTGAWLFACPVRALGVVAMAAATLGVVVTVAGGDPATRTLAVLLVVFTAGAVATRSRHSWGDIQATRGYQLVAAALEPPDPPEGSRASESGESEVSTSGEDAGDEARDGDSQP